ncbi:hypothetical protein ACSVBT_06855 [Afipia sp. TerB]
MTYPIDDNEFSETKITEVRKESSGWSVTRDDGWSNWIDANSPVEPEVGMTQRQYGRGVAFRGIYLNGQKVFYRTKDEDAEHHDIQRYGADAADWLSRWDAGRGVWSIEMGGLGPGYEQCIQIVAAEVLRHLIDKGYDASRWEDAEAWQQDRKTIEAHGFDNERVKALGISGAQWGAAVSLATALYRDGPRKVMNDERVKDRHIQVSRNFPQVAA